MDNRTGFIKKVRRKLLVISLGLLIIIMGFSGFVNYMTFSNNYNNSLVSTYAVAGNETVRKIEYALFYGKPLDNFYGINDYLRELEDVLENIEQVEIVSFSGDILYDLNGVVNDSYLPSELIETAMFQQGTVNENLSYQLHEDHAYIFIRINDDNLQHIASLLMIFPRNTFLQLNNPFTLQLAAYLIVIAIIALCILALIFSRTKFLNNNFFVNKKKVLIAFIAVLGTALVLYSGVNYFLFKSAYVDMASTSTDFVKTIVEKNIESVYSKGLTLQNIEGLDGYLESIKNSLPQIEEITLVQSSASAALQRNTINATVSTNYIDQQMKRILLDMLTVLIISVFFMIELTLLAVIMMSRGQNKAADHKSTGTDIRTSHGKVRALTFFVNICAFSALTFIPIVMKNLYQPVFGLSKEVVVGLPLSSEMLGGILAIILAGWLINKQGWRSSFYLGALFLMAGNLLSGLCESAVPFIFSRMIAGLGLGYILMAVRSLVVSLPENNAAIAEFSAGSIAGLNCGAVIGGMLADRIGYGAIFLIAAAAVVIPVIFVGRLMTEYEIETRKARNISAIAKFINFITDKKTSIFIMCIFVPFFVSGAFLDYYFPLFSSNNGLSQSDISRGILLNGLFIIYLGPVLTRYAANKLGNVKGIIASMGIVILALATFSLFGTITAAFITIILLGIAESFGVALKTTYFLNLRGIKDLEINQGIAYFSSMVNISRMAGPIIYGLALSLGARMGVGLISLIILMLLLVFILSSRVQTVQGKCSAA